MTESPESRKVTKVQRWSFLVLLPDSVLLRSPSQAKGSPHFYARTATFTPESSFTPPSSTRGIPHFLDFLTPSGRLLPSSMAESWCSGQGPLLSDSSLSSLLSLLPLLPIPLFLNFARPRESTLFAGRNPSFMVILSPIPSFLFRARERNYVTFCHFCHFYAG